MEVAIIDWKNLDSRFVRDDVYEHINAPQWFDFLAPDVAIDDDSWFCRPVCNHPKTVEDFYRQTPPNSKKSSGGLSKRLPFAELTIKRDSTLKKRGLASYAPIFPNDSKSDTFTLDSENQNPNFSTPLNHKSRVHKATFKSSTEKKEQTNDKSSLKKEQSRSLKSTLSARNLFSGGGGDILSKVTEFCNELKKLTLRKKEKEEEHTEAVICVGDSSNDESPKFDVKEPLLHEANSENCKPLPGVNNMLEKSRRKIRYEDENTPVKIDVKIFKMSEEENLLPIRTCPPTPQCISATRVPSKASPLKEIIPLTPQERDTGYRKPNWKNEQGGCQINQGRQAASAVTDKEAKGIDVFWFLKPCKIST